MTHNEKPETLKDLLVRIAEALEDRNVFAKRQAEALESIQGILDTVLTMKLRNEL